MDGLWLLASTSKYSNIFLQAKVLPKVGLINVDLKFLAAFLLASENSHSQIAYSLVMIVHVWFSQSL